MELYINATGCISPQNTFGDVEFLKETILLSGNRCGCIEPEYKKFIDPKMSRRMSRVIRMGVAAANYCLQEAGLDKPDAIVTGTAYGCLEDTGVFISRMVEQNETLLTPTAFIQSTHNTIGAQIGLLIGSHGYNNAIVHRGFSFERSLQDAFLLIAEAEAKTVLVGAVDEITDFSHAILQRFGIYQKENETTGLTAKTQTGAVAGEGATFFLLSQEKTDQSYAKIIGFETLYKPASATEVQTQLKTLMRKMNLSFGEIDLVVTGKNGALHNDKIYDQNLPSDLKVKPQLSFKQLCGDYPTASAFGVWVAAKILKTKVVPAALQPSSPITTTPKLVLVYSHYLNIHHSFFVLEIC